MKGMFLQFGHIFGDEVDRGCLDKFKGNAWSLLHSNFISDLWHSGMSVRYYINNLHF
jgi:myosin-crossreactive antigen